MIIFVPLHLLSWLLFSNMKFLSWSRLSCVSLTGKHFSTGIKTLLKQIPCLFFEGKLSVLTLYVVPRLFCRSTADVFADKWTVFAFSHPWFTSRDRGQSVRQAAIASAGPAAAAAALPSRLQQKQLEEHPFCSLVNYKDLSDWHHCFVADARTHARLARFQ